MGCGRGIQLIKPEIEQHTSEQQQFDWSKFKRIPYSANHVIPEQRGHIRTSIKTTGYK